MTNDFYAPGFLFVSAYSMEDFMVREDIVALYWWRVIGIPSF